MVESPGGLTDEEQIDPELARFVSAIQAGYAAHPDLAERSLPERRAIAETVREPWRQGGPVMARRSDHLALTAVGQVLVRVFEPEAEIAPRPALVYCHGGGFTSFSLDTHDRLMREYAARAGIFVVGVDYALSPEAKFPTALNQVIGVIDWLVSEGPALGISPGHIAVGGDSAGANLAMAAALSLRDRGDGGRIAGMLLNYGFFDADYETASQRRHGGPDKLLTRDELAEFLDNYLGGTQHGANPLALPSLADLQGLPPSFSVIAQCDPLADGDRAMLAKLKTAGSCAEGQVYAGAVHSFLEAVSISSIAEQALAESGQWLRRTLQT